MYYVFVTRLQPVKTQGVERWTLDQIKHFITQQNVSETPTAKQSTTYSTTDCKVFVTNDIRDLALQK